MTQFSNLLDGYRRFHQNRWSVERERWDTLSKGQSPKVMIIG